MTITNKAQKCADGGPNKRRDTMQESISKHIAAHSLRLKNAGKNLKKFVGHEECDNAIKEFLEKGGKINKLEDSPAVIVTDAEQNAIDLGMLPQEFITRPPITTKAQKKRANSKEPKNAK